MKPSKMKIARIGKGLTQVNIYKKTGISQAVISRIENGLIPNKWEAYQIASVLETEPEKLFKVIKEK